MKGGCSVNPWSAADKSNGLGESNPTLMTPHGVETLHSLASCCEPLPNSSNDGGFPVNQKMLTVGKHVIY